MVRTQRIIGLALSAATLGYTAGAAAQDSGGDYRLEEIIVTAQKRQIAIQDSALSVVAITGDALEKDRNLSFADVARSITGFSYTGNTTFDQELNMRGVTNTRVDAPTADPSVGVFVDGVYVGRTGLLNMDLYDIERVEVIRGPQGVLLGKNVVGGAMSIISRAPEQEASGSLSLSFGNFNDVRATGYATGGLSETVSGRFSFQYRDHDGYAHDVLNDREMEDLRSVQLRGQLLYESRDSDLTARLMVEYSDDDANPPAAIAINSPTVPSPFTGDAGPWSIAREAFGQIRGRPLSIRETTPEIPTYLGDPGPTPPQQHRESINLALDVEIPIGDNVIFNSVTGYRDGEGLNVYDQTGIGPQSANFNPLPFFLFTFPVNEAEDIQQFSQEFRFTSDNAESNIDWIAGLYYQNDDVEKIDRFQAEIPVGVPNLNGESRWDNSSTNKSLAVFGQLGYQLTDQWKVAVGARWTRDEKDGVVIGTAIATGDIYNPADVVPLTPLQVVPGFTQPYGNTWEEFTPQLVVEYAANENALLYANLARGYKGGAWEDTPPNGPSTDGTAAVDPETVISYELGGKFDFMDNRARLNFAAFYMDYEDLQVAQTKDSCNCNIIDNASNAEITGVEAEFTIAATENLLVWLSGNWLETEYVEFIDDEGNDNSGGFLQRTPDIQFAVGAELTTDLGDWEDALSFRVNYAHQGELFWAPTNAESEDSFGLLDARISLAPLDETWSLSIYGKNLTDEEYRNHVIPFLGDNISFFAPPRTYGVDFGFRF